MTTSTATRPANAPKRTIGNSLKGDVFDPAQHFYDGQVRRYLLQVMKLFTGLTIITGTDPDGTVVYREVPIRFAGSDRQVASILSNNTENAMASLPHMFFNVTGMVPEPARRMDPSYEENIQLRERARSGDPRIDRPGRNISIDRLMPAAWGMQVSLDIVTTNIDSKLQIFEQFSPLFAGPIEITASDSVTDWTRLTQIELSDFTWSSRSVPYGTDLALDTMTAVLSVPIWLTLPVRVSRQVLINQVRTAHRLVQEGQVAESERFADYFSDVPADAVQMYGPTSHTLEVTRNRAVLTGGPDAEPSWARMFRAWNAVFNEGESRLLLRVTDNEGKAVRDVVVFMSSVPGQPAVAEFRVDRDTLEANDWIIDATVNPGNAMPMDAAATIRQGAGNSNRTSGLFVVVDCDGTDAWTTAAGGEPVLEGDLISITASPVSVRRIKRFRGPDQPDEDGRFPKYENRVIKETAQKHALNTSSGMQLRWDPKEGIWHYILDGTFYPGNWKVIP